MRAPVPTAALDYPVCLRLAGRRVLVVGGGEVARRRVIGLVAAGARVDVVAPRVHGDLDALAAARTIGLARRPWQEGDLAGAAIAVVAIDDRTIAARIAAAARARGVPITVADQPALCDFTMPSVGRRGPITLAVSTGGLAPAVAARVRRRLEAAISDDDLAIARRSAAVRRALPPGRARMALVRTVVALASAGARFWPALSGLAPTAAPLRPEARGPRPEAPRDARRPRSDAP